MNYNLAGLDDLRANIRDNTVALFEWMIAGMARVRAAEIIRTQDPSASSLADALTELDNLITKFGQKADQLGMSAQFSVDQFIRAVVANETRASTDVSAINESLSTIGAQLDDISF